MTRPTNTTNERKNYSRSNSPRSSSSRSSSNNRRPNHSRTPAKKYSKGMILLKSSVIALFVVLITLCAAFYIMKNSKVMSHTSFAKCKGNAQVSVKSEIDEIVVDRSGVYVLTERRDGVQEIVKLGNKCLEEKGRVTFKK